jgi:hypothetical protein
MSAFKKLKTDFDINWTTILAGWNGLGPFSPWPDRRDEFPPFFSADELVCFANERLDSSTDASEVDLILQVLSLNLRTEHRQTIRDLLARLSDLTGSDPAFELRKWRLVLLEELLSTMPNDATYGLTALTEFWQGFGFPPDSPHQVQGRGNEIVPSEYYQDDTLQRLLAQHRTWVKAEKEAIGKHATR